MMNLITRNEMEMITVKMEQQILREGATPNNIKKSVDTMLNNWAGAKGAKLFNLLGENLILKKRIRVEKDIPQLLESLQTRLRHHLYGLRAGILTYEAETGINNDELILQIDKWMWNSEALATNKIDRPFSFTGDSKKAIKIGVGQKFTKALSKIYKEFYTLDEGDFEIIRLEQSRVLNDRVIEGTLCLSIHPLDYFTMSDNDNGWNSCMSFDDKGCYRAGVLECLNCTNTLVAYLESDTKKYLIGEQEWNSKKYRQLVLFDEKFILTNKSYPFRNDELSKTVLNWVAELAGENYAGDNIFEDDYQADDIDGIIGFRVDTDMMYNDHDYNSFSYIRMNKHITDEDIEPTGLIYTSINGVAKCLECGSEIEKEASLLCNECANFCTCAHCEEILTEEETYYIGDVGVCEYCHDEYGCYCRGCGETFYDEDGRFVDYDDETYVVPDWEDGFYCDCCLQDLELREEEEDEEE